MQQALPSIPLEVKQRLEAKGFKKFKPSPLKDYLNPHKSSCNDQ